MIPNFFKDNKYTKWYFSIITNPSLSASYYEVHHIIPRSMGGDNSKDNLVRLSARQHFVVHKLLTKMINGPFKHKAKQAFICMCLMKSTTNPKEKIKLKSWEYEYVKKNISISRKIALADPIVREKMSKSIKAAWADPVIREKISKSVPTAVRSARAKLCRTVEVIEKHRKQLIGRKHTEETKEKMAAARRKRFEDPEYRSFIKSTLLKASKIASENSKIKRAQKLKDKLEKPIKYNWKLTSPENEIILVVSVNAFCKENNLTISHLMKYMKLDQAVPCGKKHRFGKHQSERQNTEGWKLERL